MSTQWADYAITCVRYVRDAYGNRLYIGWLGVRYVHASTIDSPQLWTREQVIHRIESGTRFITAFSNNGSDFYPGDDVRVVTAANWKKYLRTDGNRTDADNLGSLPEC